VKEGSIELLLRLSICNSTIDSGLFQKSWEDKNEITVFKVETKKCGTKKRLFFFFLVDVPEV